MLQIKCVDTRYQAIFNLTFHQHKPLSLWLTQFIQFNQKISAIDFEKICPKFIKHAHTIPVTVIHRPRMYANSKSTIPNNY